MKFIVGLGNPGNKYQHSRHNIGFKIIDKLALDQEWKSGNKGQLEYVWLETNQEKVELIKPQTFMNKSGLALSYVKKKHPQLEEKNLFVIHDDLDLRLGNYKIQLGTGPKQHNGLLSIYQHLGTDQFWHVRIGIDGRGGDRSIPADKYVLSSFTPDERLVLEQVINQVVAELERLI
jgi:peptidyl-tRNA hydrolase, PTH1 family